MNLILFGFKGCGKTYFGRKLAELLRRPFIDTDDLILELYAEEAKERLSIPEIHQKLSETGFRALEKQAVFSLPDIENSIISLGGGAILDPDNRAFLQKLGALVYLKADPALLKERMQRQVSQGKTPAFFDEQNWEDSFWHMIQERRPLFESIPCRSVDVSLLDNAGVLAALESILILEDRPDGFR